MGIHILLRYLYIETAQGLRCKAKFYNLNRLQLGSGISTVMLPNTKTNTWCIHAITMQPSYLYALYILVTLTCQLTYMHIYPWICWVFYFLVFSFVRYSSHPSADFLEIFTRTRYQWWTHHIPQILNKEQILYGISLHNSMDWCKTVVLPPCLFWIYASP